MIDGRLKDGGRKSAETVSQGCEGEKGRENTKEILISGEREKPPYSSLLKPTTNPNLKLCSSILALGTYLPVKAKNGTFLLWELSETSQSNLA